MAFAPAQNHEVKFPVSLIHQVPSVPAKQRKTSGHTEKTTEAGFVPVYWCRTEQKCSRDSRGRVCAAYVKLRGGMNLHIFIVGKVNVIPICQSKYDLSFVRGNQRPPVHNQVHSQFFFFSCIYKGQNVPDWRDWRNCVFVQTLGRQFWAWKVAPQRVCVYFECWLDGFSTLPPLASLIKIVKKSPALEFFCCRETARLSQMNLDKLINKQVLI